MSAACEGTDFPSCGNVPGCVRRGRPAWRPVSDAVGSRSCGGGPLSHASRDSSPCRGAFDGGSALHSCLALAEAEKSGRKLGETFQAYGSGKASPSGGGAERSEAKGGRRLYRKYAAGLDIGGNRSCGGDPLQSATPTAPPKGEPFAAKNCGNVPGCIRRGRRPRRPVGWTWSEAGGTPPHPPRLIRPCGPPSPQGEGLRTVFWVLR